jgi:hypothetical protein
MSWAGTTRVRVRQRLQSGNFSISLHKSSSNGAWDARDGSALLSMRTRESRCPRARMETTLTRACSARGRPARIVQNVVPSEGARRRGEGAGAGSDGGGAASELALRWWRRRGARGSLVARYPLRCTQGDDPMQQRDRAREQAHEDAEGNDLGGSRHDEMRRPRPRRRRLPVQLAVQSACPLRAEREARSHRPGGARLGVTIGATARPGQRPRRGPLPRRAGRRRGEEARHRFERCGAVAPPPEPDRRDRARTRAHAISPRPGSGRIRS